MISPASEEFSQVSADALSAAGNWQAKYRLIMLWGKAIEPKPWLRRDEHRVRGCETSLWLRAMHADDRWYFHLDGESRVIKGLAALVLAPLEGTDCAGIDAAVLLDRLHAAGVSPHLSPSRNNGLRALINRLGQILQ